MAKRGTGKGMAKAGEKDARFDRRAAALRANLARRKARQRALREEKGAAHPPARTVSGNNRHIRDGRPVYPQPR